MITRRHVTDSTRSDALYSDCEQYRYRLRRTWDPGGPDILFVMLNPSTATELRNDPTIERCERRARDSAFGRMTICNLFGWRATDPRDLKAATDPVGPCNDSVLLASAKKAGMVVCAWGVHGDFRKRGRTVAQALAIIGPLHHIGLTRDGHPRHPLYLPYSKSPESWRPAIRPDTPKRRNLQTSVG
ncbi:MAG: DUF1643 domain-containing protein [Pseudomonadota bacterium]